MADYPTSIWTPPVRGTNMSDAVTQTDILDEQNAEIVAMQTEGGTSPSGWASTMAARFTALDNSVDISASTTFTPAFSNLTVGASTLSGRRVRIGPEMHVEVSIACGAGFAISGTLGMTLPVNCVSQALGVATYLDSGTRHFVGAVQFSSASDVLFAHSESGNVGLVDATNPFTWTVGDVLRANLVYLAG